MKIVLNYDPATGQISDKTGMDIFMWQGLQYEEMPEESSKGGALIDGEQLIRIMKISAHVSLPNKVKDI